jgi:hypothetical protein
MMLLAANILTYYIEWKMSNNGKNATIIMYGASLAFITNDDTKLALNDNSC